jgi:hypothetical protein
LTTLLLLVGAGYVAGLLLTPLSLLLAPIDLLIMRVLRIHIGDWRRGLSRNDEVAAKDKDAGATLAKMQAESTLCKNLFSAFLLLIILNDTHRVTVPAVDAYGRASRWIILLILGSSAIFRTAVYLGRQNHLYEIVVRNPRARGASVPGR